MPGLNQFSYLYLENGLDGPDVRRSQISGHRHGMLILPCSILLPAS